MLKTFWKQVRRNKQNMWLIHTWSVFSDLKVSIEVEVLHNPVTGHATRVKVFILLFLSTTSEVRFA